MQSNTNAWNNIYGLHDLKPNEEFVQEENFNDEEDDDEKYDIEDMDDHTISEDLPEIQDIQDFGPEKIATEVMASLPNSLRKDLVPSSLEKVATNS